MSASTRTQPQSSSLLLQWIITGLAIYGAFVVVPGISFTGNWYEIAIIAFFYSAINVLVRPVLVFLSIPLVMITFGLFMRLRLVKWCKFVGSLKRQLLTALAGFAGFIHGLFGEVAALQTPFSV
jgi:uncharacterized membrane protein YvlD (DUF360 family)